MHYPPSQSGEAAAPMDCEFLFAAHWDDAPDVPQVGMEGPRCLRAALHAVHATLLAPAPPLQAPAAAAFTTPAAPHPPG